MAERSDEDRDDLSPEEQRALFWKRLEGLNAGMLGYAADGKLVPMSHNVDDESQSVLWFIGAAGTHLADAAPGEALYVIADSGGKLYARLHGRLEIVQDRAKLEELWNPVASSWYDGGIDDPDVRLFRFGLSNGEIWTTTGTSGFLWELAKNKLTGATPDMGEHFELTF